MTKKKESHGLKASKILYVVNALWRKKAILQILFDWRSCPVGLLYQELSIYYFNLNRMAHLTQDF